MKKKVLHRIVFDQKDRALKIARARRKGMSMNDAVTKYADGANRVSAYIWLKKYTDFYSTAKKRIRVA